MIELAKHNTRNNCWLLINNKVYDVSSYIDAHPGAASTIIPVCGKEATRAFDTKNQGSPHSSYADSLLNGYLLGPLNSTIQGKTNTTAPSSKPVIAPDPISRQSIDLSKSELIKHNTINNCWLLINNKVYAVSAYLRAHPGGVGTISPFCGKEASAAFNTKNQGQLHSNSADQLLAKYLLGNMGAATSASILQSTQNQAVPSSSRENDD